MRLARADQLYIDFGEKLGVEQRAVLDALAAIGSYVGARAPRAARLVPPI